MKVGDLVVFMDNGRYAKWFYGQMGVVESCAYSRKGKLYCSISWLQPVKYFDSMTTNSSFPAEWFEVHGEQ